jgi:hypothetical protein
MRAFSSVIGAALAVGMISASPQINVLGVLFVLMISAMVGLVTWVLLNVLVREY